MPGKMQGYTGTRYTHLGTQPDRQEVSWPSRAHSPSLMFTLACLLMMHPLAQWSQILHSPQFFSLFLAVKQDNFFFSRLATTCKHTRCREDAVAKPP